MTHWVGNPRSIFSKFVLNKDRFSHLKKSNNSNVSAPVHGLLMEFLTSHLPITCHDSKMYK